MNLVWNGIPIPNKCAQSCIKGLQLDPETEDRLWSTWCCFDALILDDLPAVLTARSGLEGVDPLFLAELIEAPDFLETSPVFEPIPEWIRSNTDKLTIEPA